MNYILGCILGAFYGDASGATLEFYRGPFSSQTAFEAMELPGKGRMWLGEGQVTDDSELAMSLAIGLLKDNTKEINYDNIAFMYQKWFLSEPFDIGATICSILYEIKNEPLEGLSDKMIEFAKFKSANSKSNGSLMRSTPIPIFSYMKKMNLDETFELAKKDASLTHSNSLVQEVNGIYAIAIRTLLENHKNVSSVLENCQRYIKDEEVASWFSIATSYFFKNSIGPLENNNESNLERLKEELDTLTSCMEQQGYLKHAFILAFTLLVNKIPYKEAICLTIMCGGDTDTNACIVGGLLGAYWGYDNLPKEQVMKMLKYQWKPNEEEIGHERPNWLHPKNILEIIKQY